ncbi:MAG TPA: hypothetical protein VHC86_09705 [Opitutaceae bacterium]|nr:hypothetical protein [Opitutaceae bacterium]
MKLIQEASRRADVSEIERLSRIAKRAKEIDLHLTSLTTELTDLNAAVDRGADSIQPHAPAAQSFPFEPSGRRGELQATLDWAACGIARPRAVVCEAKASETLVAFVAELVAARGPETLERLAQVRVNRGPLVSAKPEVDYRNSKSGLTYQHQQLPGTQFYVLTHSSTDEKLDNIRTAWRALGLPPGGLSVHRAA